MEYGYNNDYSLKLHINIYSQKKAERLWYKYLTKKLIMELMIRIPNTSQPLF